MFVNSVILQQIHIIINTIDLYYNKYKTVNMSKRPALTDITLLRSSSLNVQCTAAAAALTQYSLGFLKTFSFIFSCFYVPCVRLHDDDDNINSSIIFMLPLPLPLPPG